MRSTIQHDRAGLTDLHEILAAVDRAGLPATYLQAARDVRRLEGTLAPIRVSLLSSFTLDLLRPYLEVELARHRLAGQLHVAPFNTVSQQLLDPHSDCARHAPDVVFVAQRLGDICPPLADNFLSLTSEQVETLTNEVISNTVGLLEAFRGRSDAAVAVHNFALPAEAELGIYEASAARSQTAAIRELNARLVQALKAIPGAYVLDCDRVAATVGYRNYYDDKMWYLGRAPLAAAALAELARVQAAFAQAVLGRQAKCLVVDLDGTLWGGVVGELGPQGIQLGDGYPGSPFRDFQRTLLALSQRGVLLAINSKNNPKDAEDVIDSHPHMLLRREHFAAVRINWRDKPHNMREIAEELNIGLDSLVFFDDHPAERALMRDALPQVRTLEVPSDPLMYRHVLHQSRAFDRLSFSDEDRRRAGMYQAQSERRALEVSVTSLESFLENLQMCVEIEPVTDATLPRVLDLVQKTNQFNVTTRRHSAAELARLSADPSCGVFTMRLRDRFGDQGIVGVAIVILRGGEAHLDTFLLSCRVIGRTAETALLWHLADWARSRHADCIAGEFIPTAKNAPASDVFARHGFTDVGGEGDLRRWRLALDDVPFEWPAYITANRPARD